MRNFCKVLFTHGSKSVNTRHVHMRPRLLHDSRNFQISEKIKRRRRVWVELVDFSKLHLNKGNRGPKCHHLSITAIKKSRDLQLHGNASREFVYQKTWVGFTILVFMILVSHGTATNAATLCLHLMRAHRRPSPKTANSPKELAEYNLEVFGEKRKPKAYDKWNHEEQQVLVWLWAERFDCLESKDAREVWDEIARELNNMFGTNRPVDKCKVKIKCLIDKYKGAKDWNLNQSRGHRRQTPFCEEIDADNIDF